MPKNRSLKRLPQKSLRARWKLCALRSHWHVRSVNSEITTRQKKRRIILTEWKQRSTANSVRDTQCTRKQNNSGLV